MSGGCGSTEYWQLKSGACGSIVANAGLLVSSSSPHAITKTFDMHTVQHLKENVDLNIGNYVQMTRGTVVRHNYFLQFTKPHYIFNCMHICLLINSLVRT